MSRKHVLCISLSALFVVGPSLGLAQDFDLSWHTIDGGGATFSTGGAFELGGTVGQPDAGSATRSGGTYQVVGGFWSGPSAVGLCACPGDLNQDGQIDGDDVQTFVTCLLSSGPACACADLDGSGDLSVEDVPLFVSSLLNGTTCP